MTREEAIQEWTNNATGCFEDGIEIINTIYNDFENRTCKNCKYFNGLPVSGIINCKKMGNIKCNNEFDYSFGCNKWENKTKNIRIEE